MMLSEREIFLNAKGFECLQGIYFLIDKDEIIYVGESNNVYDRINEHLNERKLNRDFDSYSIDIMPLSTKKERRQREAMYIMIYKPECNTVYNTGEVKEDTMKYFCNEVKEKYINKLR